MGHQPEYRQSHSHEQIEPVPSFGWEKEGQIAFHRFACRNLSNPERLISHAITPPKKSFSDASLPSSSRLLILYLVFS